MRQGRTFKRCSKCGGRVPDKRCLACGSDAFSWAYVVDVAPAGAPREQRRAGGFATKSAALAAMNELQTAKAAGTHIEASRQTVAAYLEAWLAGIKGSVRGGTFASYQLNARRLGPVIGVVPLQQLTRNQVKAAYQTLGDSGGKTGGGLSSKTVHNVHLCLRKALGDAVEDRLIPFNPAEAAHKLPGDRPEMLTWSGPELRTFLEGTEGDPNHALWRLASHTGMRRGELLGLRWRDVDLAAPRLSVVQQLVRAGDRIAFGPPKTSKGRRSLALDPGTAAVLEDHQRAQHRGRWQLGPAYKDQDLVFARPDGSPLDPDVVSAQFDRQLVKLGLRRIRFHDLRHTHATLGLAAGVHPKVMQERLGHSSIAVTLDLYSHVVPAMQEDAAARIAAVVAGT